MPASLPSLLATLRQINCHQNRLTSHDQQFVYVIPYMFHIALFEPKMPANTGNIIRLVANNGCYLHLIEPLAFNLEEKNLRRAGLDYRDLANVKQHRSYQDFAAEMAGRKIFACTTKGSQPYDKNQYQPGDVFVFGSETAGLPPDVLESLPAPQRIRIPMMPNNRSLNLSNAVAIISYEAWRQQNFQGGS
jgi:tRNA (cytidine/uridine-2'-O-)-methyltransferase